MLSADERWFESFYVDVPNLQYGWNGLFYGELAQWLAQDAYIITVGGSSPSLPTNLIHRFF